MHIYLEFCNLGQKYDLSQCLIQNQNKGMPKCIHMYFVLILHG